MKKIINAPEKVVADMIEGIAIAHSELRVLEGTQVLVRNDTPVHSKVGLISGGGSGHEPAHAGFVGKGMLDAACAGDVFTSPAVDQMMAGIRAINAGAGVLIIAKNYTGDNLNFDMAAELLQDEGIQVDKVIVKDDVAVEESANTTGRRGVAGTILVHKIAGAKAELGAPLEEVKKAAQKAINNVRTFGVALDSCIIPSVGKPSFTLSEDEIELGTGIHGETGVKRTSVLTAAELAQNMMERILSDLPYISGDEVAVMINGAGSTPLMELYILCGEVAKILNIKGIKICKCYVGEYMTSLEMAGCSITLLKVDDELKELLLAPANTPAFKQF